jgi:hypothetical protein
VGMVTTTPVATVTGPAVSALLFVDSV